MSINITTPNIFSNCIICSIQIQPNAEKGFMPCLHETCKKCTVEVFRQQKNISCQKCNFICSPDAIFFLKNRTEKNFLCNYDKIPIRSRCDEHDDDQMASVSCSCGKRLCNECAQKHGNGFDLSIHQKRFFNELTNEANQILNEIIVRSNRDIIQLDEIFKVIKRNKQIVKNKAKQARDLVQLECSNFIKALRKRQKYLKKAIDKAEQIKISQLDKVEEEMNSPKKTIKQVDELLNSLLQKIPKDDPERIHAQLFAQDAFNLLVSKQIKSQIFAKVENAQSEPKFEYHSTPTILLQNIESWGSIDVDKVNKTPTTSGVKTNLPTSLSQLPLASIPTNSIHNLQYPPPLPPTYYPRQFLASNSFFNNTNIMPINQLQQQQHMFQAQQQMNFQHFQIFQQHQAYLYAESQKRIQHAQRIRDEQNKQILNIQQDNGIMPSQHLESRIVSRETPKNTPNTLNLFPNLTSMIHFNSQIQQNVIKSSQMNSNEFKILQQSQIQNQHRYGQENLLDKSIQEKNVPIDPIIISSNIELHNKNNTNNLNNNSNSEISTSSIAYINNTIPSTSSASNLINNTINPPSIINPNSKDSLEKISSYSIENNSLLNSLMDINALATTSEILPIITSKNSLTINENQIDKNSNDNNNNNLIENLTPTTTNNENIKTNISRKRPVSVLTNDNNNNNNDDIEHNDDVKRINLNNQQIAIENSTINKDSFEKESTKNTEIIQDSMKKKIGGDTTDEAQSINEFQEKISEIVVKQLKTSKNDDVILKNQQLLDNKLIEETNSQPFERNYIEHISIRENNIETTSISNIENLKSINDLTNENNAPSQFEAEKLLEEISQSNNSSPEKKITISSSKSFEDNLNSTDIPNVKNFENLLEESDAAAVIKISNNYSTDFPILKNNILDTKTMDNKTAIIKVNEEEIQSKNSNMKKSDLKIVEVISKFINEQLNQDDLSIANLESLNTKIQNDDQNNQNSSKNPSNISNRIFEENQEIFNEANLFKEMSKNSDIQKDPIENKSPHKINFREESSIKNEIIDLSEIEEQKPIIITIDSPYKSSKRRSTRFRSCSKLLPTISTTKYKYKTRNKQNQFKKSIKKEEILINLEDWDDYCFICQEGCDENSGNLGCCSKCPKVFHNSCHVPKIHEKMDDLPDDWTCSLCTPMFSLTNRSKKFGNWEKFLCSKVLLSCFERPNDSATLYEQIPISNKEYLAIIQQQPICLKVIGEKISNNAYENVQQFIEDMNLLFKNSSTYNKPLSNDALSCKEIFKLYNSAVMKFLPAYYSRVWIYSSLYN